MQKSIEAEIKDLPKPNQDEMLIIQKLTDFKNS